MTSQGGGKANQPPIHKEKIVMEGFDQDEGSSSGRGDRVPITIDDMIKLQSNMIEKFGNIVANALQSNGAKQTNTAKTTKATGATGHQEDDNRSTGKRPNHGMGSETIGEEKKERKKRDVSEMMWSFDSRRSQSHAENDIGTKRQSPFSTNILTEKVNPKQKWPVIDRYYGYTGPLEHLRAFDDALDLHSDLSDAFQCRLFLNTLKGEARIWFDNLPTGSVTSFSKLRKLFLGNYASLSKPPNKALSLLTVKQEADESLRDYISRFNRVLSSMKGISLDIYILTLSAGLLPGELFSSMERRPIKSRMDLLERIDRYIKQDDNNHLHDLIQEDSPKVVPLPVYSKKLITRVLPRPQVIQQRKPIFAHQVIPGQKTYY